MSHHASGPNFGFPRGDARLDMTDEYVLYTKTRNFHWNVVGPRHLSHSPSALVGRENAPYEFGKVDRPPFPASQSSSP